MACAAGKEASLVTLLGYQGLFTSPYEQLNNVRTWNDKRGWGFTNGDFPPFPRNPPSINTLEVPVLAVFLPSRGVGRNLVPGYVRTARELWEIARNRQRMSLQGGNLQFDANYLRLLEGTEIAHKPGIRWVMANLGAHWSVDRPVELRDVRGSDSAHAEILAAAAHFPNWLRAMNGTEVPFVWLPGYQVRAPDEGSWAHAPYLHRQLSSGVILGVGQDTGLSRVSAMPECREL